MSPVESSIDRPATPVSMQRRHVRGDPVGIVGEAVLEIGIDRNIGRGGDLAVVREHRSSGTAPSAKPCGMGVAGAGGRQRLEAEALEIARAADVPRIGNDEAAGLRAACGTCAFVGGRRTGAGMENSCYSVGDLTNLPRRASRGQRICVIAAMHARDAILVSGGGGLTWIVSTSTRWRRRRAPGCRRPRSRSARPARMTRSRPRKTSRHGGSCACARACCATSPASTRA